MTVFSILQIWMGVLLGGFVTAHFAQADPVRITYSSWCPHICTDENEVLLEDKPGFAIELAREAFADQGYDTDLISLPFSRQLKDVSTGLQDAVIHIKQTPDRDYVWPSVSTGIDQQCFVVQKSSDWSYNGVDSLKDITIGGITGYRYGALTDYMADPANKVEYLSGEKTDLRNLEKVAMGRIDAFLDDSTTNAYVIQENGLSDELKFAGCLEPIELFLAFSPVLETSTEYAAALDRGLTAMREDGRFDAILSKYGLSDWGTGS